MNVLVKTHSAIEYLFECHHFNIIENIAYFYEKDGEAIWVIKEWISFRNVTNSETKTPDEFYENINKEDE